MSHAFPRPHVENVTVSSPPGIVGEATVSVAEPHTVIALSKPCARGERPSTGRGALQCGSWLAKATTGRSESLVS